MKIVCTSHDGIRRVTFSLNVGLHLVLPALLLALSMAGILYQTKYAKPPQLTQANNADISHRLELADDLQAYENGFIELDLLARRVGILESESLRLNTFGARIVTMAKLDPEEFAFDAKPSLGGRPLDEVGETGSSVPETTATELMGTLRVLETELKAQRKRLKKMTDVLHGRILQRNAAKDSAKRKRTKNTNKKTEKNRIATGMPVRRGYISSSYGMRRDPFTGKKRMHQGIDFAAKKGTKVIAINSGLISFTGRKGAYGNVVEVTHAKGTVSRYAHLSKILVRVGDRVKKGKEIAEVGSTGRSTGAHLHLEVLNNGKREDPHRHISSSVLK